jgi:hypothetical protein
MGNGSRVSVRAPTRAAAAAARSAPSVPSWALRGAPAEWRAWQALSAAAGGAGRGRAWRQRCGVPAAAGPRPRRSLGSERHARPRAVPCAAHPVVRADAVAVAVQQHRHVSVGSQLSRRGRRRGARPTCSSSGGPLSVPAWLAHSQPSSPGPAAARHCCGAHPPAATGMLQAPAQRAPAGCGAPPLLPGLSGESPRLGLSGPSSMVDSMPPSMLRIMEALGCSDPSWPRNFFLRRARACACWAQVGGGRLWEGGGG